MADGTKTDGWGAHALEYNRLVQDVMTRVLEALIQAADNVWPFSTATAILDNGTGTGACLSAIIDRFGPHLPANARLIASDLSPGMVDFVREKRKSNAGVPAWDRLETAVLDSQDLADLRDDSLSHMTASFMFFFAADPRRALREAKRVLTGGGVLALSSWADMEWCRLFEVAKQINPDAPQGLPFPDAWKSAQGVRAELEAVGFRNINVQEVQTYMPFDNPEIAVSNLVRSNNPGINRMLVGLAPDQVDEVAKLMIQRLDRDYPVLPAKMTGTALIATAQK